MKVTVTSLSRPSAAFTLHDGYDRLSWQSPLVTGLQRDGLEGWFEGVAPRAEDPEIPNGDGTYGPADIWLASRIVTLRFAARAVFRYGGSALHVAQFDDLVASLLKEWVEIRVEEASGVRWAHGYVSALPVRARRSEWAATYTLIVSCPDPLKYGTPVAYSTAGGGADVHNAGTAAVFPRFLVTGDVRSFRAEFDGAQIQWSGSSSGLVIDVRDMVPRDQYGNEVGTLIWAQPFQVPPGESRVVVVANRPSTVEVTPGWK